MVTFRKYWMLFILPLCFGLAGVELRGQTITFQEVDQSTYNAYQEGRWNEVIVLAERGINLGIDYYYLRVRAGIAHYHLAHYEKAIVHLKQALLFSEHDPLALEYLYYSYLFAGRTGEASLLTDMMPQGQKERIGIKNHPVFAFGETGTMFAPGADSILGYHPNMTLSSHYFVRKYNYLSGGISASLNSAVKITMAFQSINFYAHQQYFVENLDPFEYELPFTERSAYTALQINLRHAWSLNLATRWLGADYELMRYQLRPEGGNLVRDTLAYNDLALHASVFKRLPYLNLGLSGDVNYIKAVWHQQLTPSITWYPRGNINLYFSGSLSWQRSSADGATSMIGQLKLGMKLLPRWWVELFISDGKVQYWSDNQAYVVYNNLDPMVNRYGMNLLGFGISPQLDLSFRIQGSSRITSWEIYTGGEVSGYQSRKYSFISILGGLTWRF